MLEQFGLGFVLWYFVLVMNSALMAHEFGHLWYLGKYDKNAQTVWTGRKTRTEANVPSSFGPKQEAYNALTATIAGIFTIVVASIPVPITLWLVIPYTAGCVHDLKIAVRVAFGKPIKSHLNG